MLTDISTEMVNAILPIYLTLQLGFSPLHFGIFDGLYHGITALVRIGGGLIADRHKRYKEVAAIGYGLSAVSKLGLLLTGTAWIPTIGVLFVDRIGKGIRTAPRDALISLSTPAPRLGEAFGVHRALDTTGACLGPILAFALLSTIPSAYDVVFVTSFFVGIIGFGVLVSFVSNVSIGSGARPVPTSPVGSLRGTFSLFGLANFRTVLFAGIVLNCTTVSDGFVFLTLQRNSKMDQAYFPLFYVGSALVYLLLAVPMGHLADRIGRSRIFISGHALLLVLYVLLLWSSPGVTELASALLLLGAYYAATDGVLMGIASSVLPSAQIATGLAVLTTATALSRLLGSILYGALWAWYGPQLTLRIFILALFAAGVMAGFALIKLRRME